MPYYVCGWGLLPQFQYEFLPKIQVLGVDRRLVGELADYMCEARYVRSCTNLKKAGVLQRNMPTELLKVPVVRRKKALSMTWTIVSEMPSQTDRSCEEGLKEHSHFD